MRGWRTTSLQPPTSPPTHRLSPDFTGEPRKSGSGGTKRRRKKEEGPSSKPARAGGRRRGDAWEARRRRGKPAAPPPPPPAGQETLAGGPREPPGGKKHGKKHGIIPYLERAIYEVTGARLKLNSIGSEMEKIKNLTCGLDGKLDLINTKQNMSLAGVTYLVQFIEKQGGGRLPGRLEEGLQRTIRRFGEQGKLQGLGLQMLALESVNRVMAGQIHSTSINAAKLILP